MAIKGVQTFLKANSKAIKENATVIHVIKYTLKPTVSEILNATVDQVTFKLIEMREKQNDATPFNPPTVVPEFIQVGSGKTRSRRTLYKTNPNVASILPSSAQLFLIFKKAIIGHYVIQQITSEVNPFK